MLYGIFKWLFYFTVQGYFRTIQLKGASNIPNSGPVIFVANHNSAFMDPILLGVLINRPLYFLARGESFKNWLVSRFFAALNMIPVFRPEIAPKEVHKNKLVFLQCYKHLKKGKAILIFPEGFSETVRNLRPLKTGTARIALGAENEYDFNLHVNIVPIGINYSNPHHFRSTVFLNFGEPIDVSTYEASYLSDEKETVQALTEEIRLRMEKLLVIIDDERIDSLVRQIGGLLEAKEPAQVGNLEESLQHFHSTREMAAALEQCQNSHPQRMASFEWKLDKYLTHLKQLNITDSHIRTPKFRLLLLKRVLYFLLGAPVAIYGYLVNILPYGFAQFLAKKIRVRKDFIGSMKIAFGMFVFLLFYIAEIFVVGSFTHWYWAVLFAFSLYPAGLFTLNYLKKYDSFRCDYRYFHLFKRKGQLVLNLRAIRAELMEELRRIQEAMEPKSEVRRR